jgi:ferric enterobactin receptor
MLIKMKWVSLLTLFVLCCGNAAIAQTAKIELLNRKADKIFCFRSADKELDKVAKVMDVTFNFNKTRLAKYPVEYDFHNVSLAYILKIICRITKSKYFVGDNNTIYIIGRRDTYTPEVVAALQKAENREQVRLVYEAPKQFNVTVSGKVTDINTGEPLANVTVMASGKKGGATTNVDGYFTLFDVPSDTAILEFSSVGYIVSKYFLSPAKPLDSVQVQMLTAKNALSEVIVVGKKAQSFKLNQKVSMIKMTPALISTLPSVGEKDIFRSFQLMPGVSAANENSSGLYVRGGTPDQSLVLFDGFTVYNVEHLFGFFSAFNSNAIKDVSLFKGGFESKYGGRLSSVADINGKEGNKKEFNAGGDLSLMSVNVFGEGPIGKKATGIINFRRSFRTSLYNKIFDKYSGETGTETNTNSTPFGNSGQKTRSSFFDGNAKFTWKPNDKDVFSWSFYTGKDNLDNSITPQVPAFLQGSGGNFGINITDVTNWGNTGSSLKWSRKWNKKIFTNTLLGYSNYFSDRDRSAKITTTDANGKETEIRRGTLEDNNLNDFSLKTDVEIKVDKHHVIETGYHITHNDIKYSYAQNDTSKLVDRATRGNTYTAYLQDRISLFKNKLQLIPGLRTTYFDETKKWYHEPRFNATFEVTDNIKLKGSFGQYYQFAKRVIREDVLQGSRDFWVLADNDRLPVSGSQQYVVGISWENRSFLIDVEGYYKKLSGLSEYSLRFQLSPNQLSYSENFFQGSGYARGVDVLVQKKFGKYNGWMAYTLGEAVNNFEVYGKNNFYAANDVRHEFKTVHMYKWNRFDFSGTFIFATGRPYTAPSGAYSVTLLDGTVQNYFTVGAKNGNRLPAYHRLDLGVTYNFGETGSGNGSVGLSFFNLYNRQNVWYKNYEISNGNIIETDVKYLGFTPNLTFTYRLK